MANGKLLFQALVLMKLTELVHIYICYICNMGRGICLICTHEPEGAACPRARAYISGKSRPHMLHMLCNTSGTLKNLPNLSFTVLHLYIMTGAVNGYGI